jgi:DNA-binding NarL/FixJ family response regulator
MTRVLVAADSGSTMRKLSAVVAEINGALIVRYANNRTRLDGLLGADAPDLVVLADLQTAENALARLAEVRRATPSAKVVLITADTDASWLGDALRAEASAVLPGNPGPAALGIVLREVLAPRGVARERARSSAAIPARRMRRPLPRSAAARRKSAGPDARAVATRTTDEG